MSVTENREECRHDQMIDGVSITGHWVAQGRLMTMIKAFGLAFSLFLMALGLVDPMVLSTPAGF